MSTDPGYVRAQIDEAKRRAGQRQVRLLIIALLGLAVIAAFAVAGFFLAYEQARKNGEQAKRIAAQGEQIKKLAEDQATNSQTSRETLKRLTDATSSSSTQTVQALQQLDDAQRIGRADQLKKIAQMFEQCRSLPCDPGVVNRILAQPVPVPTFGAGPPARAPSPAPAKPASTAGASVGRSSTAAAVPKLCPGPVVIQATPLVLPLLPPAQVQVCIPP